MKGWLEFTRYWLLSIPVTISHNAVSWTFIRSRIIKRKIVSCFYVIIGRLIEFHYYCFNYNKRIQLVGDCPRRCQSSGTSKLQLNSPSFITLEIHRSLLTTFPKKSLTTGGELGHQVHQKSQTN